MSKEKRARSLEEFKDFADTLISCNAEEMKIVYDDWAFGYDQEVGYKEICNHGPNAVAATILQVMGNQKHARMVDLAAGTGLVSQPLKEEGFDNIDAVDYCAPMLEKAAAKNIYKNLIQSSIDSNIFKIKDDTYDMAFSVSAFFPNQILPDCFPEIHRITKPDGYAVLGFFEESFHLYEPEVERMASEHKWKILERRNIPVIWVGQCGVIYILQICK